MDTYNAAPITRVAPLIAVPPLLAGDGMVLCKKLCTPLLPRGTCHALTRKIIVRRVANYLASPTVPPPSRCDHPFSRKRTEKIAKVALFTWRFYQSLLDQFTG